MKRVVKTLAIHFFFIILFTFIYYYFSNHFDKNTLSKSKNDNGQKNYNSDSGLDLIIDFLLFSTTIQAGVGLSELYPISIQSKIIMILQQLIMISIHVITIYVFTI
jgi:hypothetical protein